MRNPLISIIIPVYNCQNFLSRCIDSVVAQTYNNYELILINDGSTDESEKICIDYAKKYNKITYYSTPNRGVSSARNTGLGLAAGEYVTFVDSDDWLDGRMLQEVINVIYATNAEIVRYGYWKEKSVASDIIVPKQDRLITTKEEMLRANEECGCYGYAWAGVYSRKCLGSLRFDESLQWCEDHIFIYESFLNCSTLFMLSKPLYHYTINEVGQSLSTRVTPFDIINVVVKEKSTFLKYGESICDLARLIYYNKICLSIELAYRQSYTYNYRKSLATLIDSIRILENGKGYTTIFLNNSIPFVVRDIIIKMLMQLKEWSISYKEYKSNK